MKKIITICLVMATVFTVNNISAQTSTGQTSFPSSVCCFNGYTWTIKYGFTFNRNNAKEVYLEIYSRTVSVKNNKYQHEGKLYSPSDLGMSQWPVSTEDIILSGTVTIYYQGNPIKSYNEAVITSKTLGTFNQYKDGGKDGPYAGIGTLKIKLEAFNINSLSVKFTNVSSGGVNPKGSEQIYKAVNAKLNGNSTNNSNSNSRSTALLINGSSTTTTKKSSKEDSNTKKDTTSSYSSNYIPERVLTQQEKEAQFYQNAGQLMSNIANQIEADRIEKEAKARREAERLARNRTYGNNLIQTHSNKALRYGDETSVKMTYLGYMNVNAKPTEEGNDAEAMAFLETINSRHYSNFAKQQLIDDHLRTINYYDHERKKRTNKTFLHAGIGGALIAGSFSFGDALSSDEMMGADTGPIVLTGAILFGGYMVFSGIFNSFFIGDYSKSSDKYTTAKNRINELNKKNVKISFSPGYNERTNDLMVGVNIRF